MRVYITCMGGHDNAELRVCDLDFSSGALRTLASTAAGVTTPLYADIDAGARFMVVADYVPECDGTPGGAICIYAIDPDSGALRYVNRRPSGGTTPCYVAASKDGSFVLAANYGDGSVSVLPVQNDGRLGEAVATVQHEGSSVTDRQKGPHAHCFRFDPHDRFALAADLGTDQVVVYRFDPATGDLSPHTPPCNHSRPGAGPRHITFSADGRFAYVINELDNTIDAMSYDAAAGALETLQTVASLPENFAGTSWASDIHVHPSGRFLYGSNRGDAAPSSIVNYKIDPATGKLTLVGHESSQGDFPRGFDIDPTGQYALVANQESNSVDTFRIDLDSGRLTTTGQSMPAPKPVCINFVESP